MQSFLIEVDRDRKIFYVRKCDAVVQPWNLMQKIVGSILLGIISISASKRQLM
jgi:hypothetical protein